MNEYGKRIKLLQDVMTERGVDYYLIPLSDYHNSEYVSEYYNVVSYLTGFTGSNATLVVTRSDAYLWTDGRYFIQAKEQLADTGVFLMKQGIQDVPTVEAFLDVSMSDEEVLAFDGRCVSTASYEKLSRRIMSKDKSRHIRDVDLIKDVWIDRTEPTYTKIWQLTAEYSGEEAIDKINRIRASKQFDIVDGVLISDLCDIAWTLNLRANDINHVPVFYSYLMITRDKVILYVNTKMLGESLEYLQSLGVVVREYSQIYDDLADKAYYIDNEIYKILIDTTTTNTALYTILNEHVSVLNATSIVANLKCIKNPVEIHNTENAHIKDGVAVTKFMYLLNTIFETGRLPEGTEEGTESIFIKNNKVTELSLANMLHQLRIGQEGFLDESFDTISAWKEHGAIVHYEPTLDSDYAIDIYGTNMCSQDYSEFGGTQGAFLLVDSGGHYLDGTTDITRTFLIGKADEEMIRDYTTVLRANIRLARAKFLEGTTGRSLDMLARDVMWQQGKDFLHGTGHGVGHILSVHEGPNNISYRQSRSAVIQPGMITTDEPGLYIEGRYGIRLENELLCQESYENEFGKFLEFNCLTLVPFELSCVDVDMLEECEREYLNAYHKRVYEVISPYLNDREKAWLHKATREI